MAKRPVNNESKLTRVIFECVRWGPVRPRDILLAAGYKSADRFDVVVRRLRQLEDRGLLYSTKSVVRGRHGGNNATWYALPMSRETWYELDYTERVKRYGKTEPWTVAR